MLETFAKWVITDRSIGFEIPHWWGRIKSVEDPPQPGRKLFDGALLLECLLDTASETYFQNTWDLLRCVRSVSDCMPRTIHKVEVTGGIFPL